jgi:hypothetical protein
MTDLLLMVIVVGVIVVAATVNIAALAGFIRGRWR